MTVTSESLAEYLQDDNNQKSFQEIVSKLGYEKSDRIKHLESSAFGKIRKLENENKELKNVLDNVDLEEYTKLKETVKLDEVETLKRTLSKTQKEAEFLKTSLSQVQGNFHAKLTEAALNDAIDSSGFDAKHKPLLRDAYIKKAFVRQGDNNQEHIFINSDDGEIPVSEYFKKFAESEMGKSYLRQPDNRGAGQVNGSGGAKDITRSAFNALSPMEQMTLVRSGVTPRD